MFGEERAGPSLAAADKIADIRGKIGAGAMLDLRVALIQSKTFMKVLLAAVMLVAMAFSAVGSAGAVVVNPGVSSAAFVRPAVSSSVVSPFLGPFGFGFPFFNPFFDVDVNPFFGD